MKLRILPLIGMAFSGLLLARAISVSSEVLPEKKGFQSPIAEQNLDAKPSQDDSGAKLADAPDSEALCLTGDVLAVLQTDKANIAERMAAVEVREKALATLEAKLSEQMELIDAANDKMEAQLGEMKSVANEDITHLVKMYQTMKPKQAAAIFESMDAAFAAGFLREMNGERAGLIMANMDSRKSYSISAIMASKNARYR